MQYSIFTLLAVAAAFVAAAPADMMAKRQLANSVATEDAAMTNANGDIIPFNAASVYQANKDAGL
ncbi:hypothetical protein CGRA01v4_04780 [Colletotrichum graminicola]|uniref:Uncharacterized protein n=1 Tax=Colletotrichum graminicola (strain M1.001 / M2 / FGSC 10212) TaxID=645133 RepID=E3QLL3_COLGM|nr:uncharacterized protein GLRG_06726 [Colletotrichum graminicola M1.001]EFQ31751.1 hypothetical protein GLRG_06726 [Colletotrichum graminicola M1.001]WDK13499.1 hypothetical protein CGRA01v4_04780 [Colletotrichum graminicola]